MPSPAPTTDPAVARILLQARSHFFVHGYCACTMDDLAAELGMSKKTLYVHFSSKEAIMRAVIEQLGREVRADAETLLANRQLGFAAKLRGFAEGMVQRLEATSAKAQTAIKGPGTYSLRFANVDDRLCLWVNENSLRSGLVSFEKGAEFDQQSVALRPRFWKTDIAQRSG